MIISCSNIRQVSLGILFRVSHSNTSRLERRCIITVYSIYATVLRIPVILFLLFCNLTMATVTRRLLTLINTIKAIYILFID